MIAPLRRRHLILNTTLLVTVPVVLVVALTSRPQMPPPDTLPAGLAERPTGDGALEVYPIFSELGIELRAGEAQGQAVVELVAERPLAQPDVLLYWSPAPVEASLGDGVVLIGSVSDRARRYALPAACASRDGHLVLYSLAHQNVLASGALPAVVAPVPESSSAETSEEAP